MRSRRPWPATSRCRTVRGAEEGETDGRRRGVRGGRARRGEVSYPPRPTSTSSLQYGALHFRRFRTAPRCAACVSPHCQRSRFFLPTTNLPPLRSPPPHPFPRSHYLFLSRFLSLVFPSFALFRYFPITGLRPFVLVLISLSPPPSLPFSLVPFLFSNDLISNFIIVSLNGLPFV